MPTDSINRKLTQSVEETIQKATSHVARSKAEETDAFLWSECKEMLGHSPIEQMFFCGIVSVAKVNAFPLYVGHDRINLDNPSDDVPRLAKDVKHQAHPIILLPQARIGQYRVDSVLYVNEGPFAVPTVVELDGHEWHERSQKQRSEEKDRDRHMQFMGMRVGRYTGSDVFKDPFRVAADALNLTISTDNYFCTAEDLWGNDG